MLIIAEIGQNHNGDMVMARKLITIAKELGAGLCKFQLYDHKELFGSRFPNVALSFGQAKDLFDYGDEIGMEVFFSVFDVERVKWCGEIGVKRYKIAYSQKDNIELFKAVWTADKPFIVSSDVPTIFSTLYCIPHYPAQVNEYMLDKLSAFDGVSDHTIGIDLAKIALARGAKIIEKHFTLDKKLLGPDHILSIEPDELAELVRFSKKCGEWLK